MFAGRYYGIPIVRPVRVKIRSKLDVVSTARSASSLTWCMVQINLQVLRRVNDGQTIP